MTVFILTLASYDFDGPTEIHGVYATAELAQKALTEQSNSSLWGCPPPERYQWNIDSFEVCTE